MTDDDVKLTFVRETDEVNRRSQRDGAGDGAEADLAAILEEHRRECARLALERSAPDRRGAVP